MSTRTIITCDECGRERTETNHWFSIINGDLRPLFVKYEEARMDVLSERFRYDLCGRECAQQALERWLSGGSVLKPEGGN